VHGLETARRTTPAGHQLLFLLNHGTEPVEVTAVTAGVDLLTGEHVSPGEPIRLDPYGVAVLQEETRD
jgi:beta-galactosidase